MSGGELTLNIGSKCQGSCRCTGGDSTGITASRKVDNNSARGFVSYIHESNDPFTLKRELTNGDNLGDNGTDISGVEKVSIYYWDGDTNHNRPLLIEVVKSASRNEPEYYYKHDEEETEAKGNVTIWRHHGYSSTSLQTRLDDRNLAINNVIPFNVGNPEEPLHFSSSRSKNASVQLVQPSPPQLNGADYVTTAYKINGRDGDTGVSRVEYNKHKINVDIPPGGMDNVRLFSSTSVDGDMPIMFNLNLKNGEKRWFYSQSTGGTSWGETGGGGFYTRDDRPTENLAKQLDGFSCEHHKAVTMDLSKNISEGGSYCCDEHANKKKDKGAKVTVTTEKISLTSDSRIAITTYKHSIGSSLKLAGIKFYHNGSENQRRHVKSNSLNFPIEGPVDIYTFYSNGSTDPKLVYIHKEGKSKAYGWYRMQTNDGHNKKWLRIPQKLKSIKHKHIKNGNLGCEQWSDLAKVLKHSLGGLPTCSGTVSKSLSGPEQRSDDVKEPVSPELEDPEEGEEVEGEDEESSDEYDQSLAQEGNPTSEDNSEDKKEKLEPDASGSHSKADGKTRSIPNVGKEADQEPLEPPGTLPKTPLSAEKTPVKKKVSESKESPLPHELISGETGRSEDFRRWQRNQMGENPLLDPYYEDLMKKKKKKEKEEQEQLQKQEELQKKTEKEGGLGSAESASTAQTEAKVIPGSNLQAEGARSAGEKVESRDGVVSGPGTASQSSSGAPPGGSQFKTPDGALLTVVDTFKQIAFALLSLTEPVLPRPDKDYGKGDATGPLTPTPLLPPYNTSLQGNTSRGERSLEDAVAERAEEPPDPPANPQPLLTTAPAVLAGYIVPSVFGGSAATFFGGWKLYNRSNGDPWASKNVHIYRAYRWNLIEEIATVYSGYYDFIPESVVSNLSDVECSHLRERCLEIRNAITVVNNGKYSLIGILKDIVTDDLSEPRSGSLKFYAQNTKLVVPSYMVDILKHSKLIKILIIDL